MSAVPRAEKRLINAARIWISAVWVFCANAITEGFEATHPLPDIGLPANHEKVCLDPASRKVSGPALPEGPAVLPRGAEGLVSGDRCRAILFAKPPVFADRDDWGDLSVDDGRVAAARVIGTISGHAADLRACGDLVEELGQNWAVTITAGSECHRPDVRSGRVHGQMELAPLASALDTVLSGLPLTHRR